MAIFSAIKYVIILLIVIAIGSGLWYVMNLKADLATSESNNQKQQDGIKEQQMLIEQMQQDVVSIQEANKSLQELNEKQKRDVNNMTSKFDKRDFGAFAASKPEVVQKLINRGTANAMRCFELAAGAALNEQEKNAKTPSEANRECPSLINPAYTNPN